MKKIFLLLILVQISCETTKKQEPTTQLDFPFEPSYQKDWKMGNQENVLLVQNLHKTLLDGEFERVTEFISDTIIMYMGCLLYTSPSPRDRTRSRMPSSA